MNHNPTTLTISLSAIKQNYRILCQKAPKAKVAAVVKANAYGLGIAPVARALEEEGCSEFFVANLDEGVELRKILPNAAIYVLHGLIKGDEKTFREHKLVPVLNSICQINLWQQQAEKINEKLPCILHVDTGMNRLGINDIEIYNGMCGALNIKYIMSHLACADSLTNKTNKQQLLKFKEYIEQTDNGTQFSLANSSGIFLGRPYHFDMVRPGLALYGGNPTPVKKNPMKQVVSLTSKILQIHHIDRPGTVGYGATYKIKKGQKIATLAIGYADGYLRSLSGKSLCSIGGKTVPLVGRVSMDLITIDVSKIPEKKLYEGAEVEIIGKTITLETVAKKAGTIEYEILTSLGSRYGRKYI